MKATESKPPTPVTYLRELMRLILEENSFKFNERHTASAMGTKMAVAFSVIYMADFEERLPEASRSNRLSGKDPLMTFSPYGIYQQKK